MKKKNYRIRFLSIIGMAFLLVSIGREVYTMINLNSKINVANTKNQKLLDEQERLQREVIKFNDAAYAQSYASGINYMTDDKSSIYMLPPVKEDAPDE